MDQALRKATQLQLEGKVESRKEIEARKEAEKARLQDNTSIVQQKRRKVGWPTV